MHIILLKKDEKVKYESEKIQIVHGIASFEDSCNHCKIKQCNNWNSSADYKNILVNFVSTVHMKYNIVTK